MTDQIIPLNDTENSAFTVKAREICALTGIQIDGEVYWYTTMDKQNIPVNPKLWNMLWDWLNRSVKSNEFEIARGEILSRFNEQLKEELNNELSTSRQLVLLKNEDLKSENKSLKDRVSDLESELATRMLDERISV